MNLSKLLFFATACFLYPMANSYAQGPDRSLMQPGRPATGTMQHSLPSGVPGKTAERPTGTEQRLIAYYVMTSDETAFRHTSDSIHFYWPPHAGKESKHYAKHYFDPYTLYTNPESRDTPTDPARAINYFRTDSIVGVIPNNLGVFDYVDLRISSVLNTEGLPVMETEVGYVFGNWENIQRRFYTYDPSASITSITYQDWYFNHWDTTTKDSYTYNSTGLITSKHIQRYNTVNQTWSDLGKHTYTYDANGNWTTYLIQGWALYDSCRYIMTYDTANRRTSLEVDTWMNATWENHIRKLYTYNTAGQCTELLYQNTPGFMDTTWENFEKYTYAYNTAGTHLSTTVRVWDFVEGDWRLDMRYLYTYSGNRLDSIVSQYYHTPWAMWINKQKRHIEYNADDLITSLWFENWTPWNDPNGSWSLEGGSSKYVFFYEDYQDNGVNALSIQDGNNTLPFQVYPNPAASQLAISIPGKLIDKVSLRDIQGREVFGSKAMNRATTVSIPVGHLPGGNYVVEVWSDKNKGSRLVTIKH